METLDKHLVVEILFDNMSITSRNANYLDIFRSSDFPTMTAASDTQLSLIERACNETVGECNNIIRAIGGIPIRAGLGTQQEYQAMLRQFTGHTKGQWFFEADMVQTRAKIQLSGTVDRVVAAYRATLNSSTEYFARDYL